MADIPGQVPAPQESEGVAESVVQQLQPILPLVHDLDVGPGLQRILGLEQSTSETFKALLAEFQTCALHALLVQGDLKQALQYLLLVGEVNKRCPDGLVRPEIRAAVRAIRSEAIGREGNGGPDELSVLFEQASSVLPATLFFNLLCVHGDPWPLSYRDLSPELAQILQQFPASCWNWKLFEYAKEAREANDFPTALRFLQHVVQMEPKNDRAWGNLGAVYKHLGRLDDARFAAETAARLQIEEKYVVLPQTLDLLRSIEFMTTAPALQASPAPFTPGKERPSRYNALAGNEEAFSQCPVGRMIAYSRQAQSARDWLAVEFFQRMVVARHPDTVRAWGVLAFALEKLEKYAEALEILETKLANSGLEAEVEPARVAIQRIRALMPPAPVTTPPPELAQVLESVEEDVAPEPEGGSISGLDTRSFQHFLDSLCNLAVQWELAEDESLRGEGWHAVPEELKETLAGALEQFQRRVQVLFKRRRGGESQDFWVSWDRLVTQIQRGFVNEHALKGLVGKLAALPESVQTCKFR